MVGCWRQHPELFLGIQVRLLRYLQICNINLALIKLRTECDQKRRRDKHDQVTENSQGVDAMIQHKFISRIEGSEK